LWSQKKLTRLKNKNYSLQPILPFTNTDVLSHDPYYLSQYDVSNTKICLNTSLFAKGNMDRREYKHGVYNFYFLSECIRCTIRVFNYYTKGR
jgi:hypothetical protein